jgi:hypothetical protein
VREEEKRLSRIYMLHANFFVLISLFKLYYLYTAYTGLPNHQVFYVVYRYTIFVSQMRHCDRGKIYRELPLQLEKKTEAVHTAMSDYTNSKEIKKRHAYHHRSEFMFVVVFILYIRF